MNGALNSCEPRDVFYWFEKITEIPHGTNHEEKISTFLCDFARERGIFYRQDEMGNVLMKKSATPGFENEPCVMLQGHMDMVCEKRTDSQHDFLKDPLEVYCKDGWVMANGTTLGADNGIAVAMMLAILDSDTVSHPALECLVTVQEEGGLFGASGFDYSDVNAQRMINLDSEEEGVATVSCAGGVRCDFSKPLIREKTEDELYYRISVDGLSGGHSGMQIALGRTNAIRALGCMLSELDERVPFSLYSIDGGMMDNAIPRNACAVIGIRAKDSDAFIVAAAELAAIRHNSFKNEDKSGKVSVDPCEKPVFDAMSQKTRDEILSMIMLVPNGVIRRDEEMIETSANLGIIRTEADVLTMTSSARSSVDNRKEDVVSAFYRLAKTCGASLSRRGDYPGWAYEPDSETRELYKKVYNELYGKEPVIMGIHAGLECGVIKAHLPQIDVISIGPDMQDVHTPDECVSTESVGRIYKTVLAMLANHS